MSQPLFDYKAFGESLVRAELLKRLLPTEAEHEAETEKRRLERVKELRKDIAEMEAEPDPDANTLKILDTFRELLAEDERPEDPPTTHCVTCTCVKEV